MHLVGYNYGWENLMSSSQHDYGLGLAYVCCSITDISRQSMEPVLYGSHVLSWHSSPLAIVDQSRRLAQKASWK